MYPECERGKVSPDKEEEESGAKVGTGFKIGVCSRPRAVVGQS